MHYGQYYTVNACENVAVPLQLEETVQVLRKRIEPAPVTFTPEPPSASVTDPLSMEEDGVDLASPMSTVPPPPLPEPQNEGEQAEQQRQEEQMQQEHREEGQEDQQLPPPPSGLEDQLKPKEPPRDQTGELVALYHFLITSV